MDRENGYLVLDSVLDELGINTSSINSIFKSENVTSFGSPSSGNFSFIYNDSRYYFKPYITYYSDPYFELIAGCILDDLNMKHVEYDLAKIKKSNFLGVISKDFKIKGATYVTGEELLSNSFDDSTGRHNNLEDIWTALDNWYRDKPNKDEIVAYLMDKIVDLYLFDIFICQSDRHPNNYQIVELDGKIDLVPIYDNEEYGRVIPNSIKVDRYGYGQISDNLRQFLEVSDIRYSNRIKDRLWVISEDNIDKIFTRIEEKTKYPMPEDIKQKYRDFFEVNRYKIRKELRIDDARRR